MRASRKPFVKLKRDKTSSHTPVPEGANHDPDGASSTSGSTAF